MGVDSLSLIPDTARFRSNAGSGAAGVRWVAQEWRRGQQVPAWLRKVLAFGGRALASLVGGDVVRVRNDGATRRPETEGRGRSLQDLMRCSQPVADSAFLRGGRTLLR